MAIQEQLPASKLSFDDMADTYGVARSADLGTMYRAGNIDMFSLRKPTDQPGLFTDDPTGIDNDRSLVCPLWTDMNHTLPQTWSYRRPTGGENSPYRGGDSAGYYRLARAFVTSGKVGTVTFEWSIRPSGNGTFGPMLVLTFNRPTHPGNLQAEHVKQHGVFLSEWYWSVLLKGRSGAGYLFVAGETELSGRVAYATLGNGGNRIEASLTAEMADDLNGGQAVFFLWLPSRSIGGLTFEQLQQRIGEGTKIGVYAGRDPGTGEVWLNPVPLSVSRRTGNIMMLPASVDVRYNAPSAAAAGYAAYPVKIAITGGDSSVIWSDRMDWEAAYTPDGVSKAFSADLQLVENPSRRSRSVTVTIYKSSYPSEAVHTVPADDKATITITQAGRPMEIIFTPKELTIDALAGVGDVFFDCPADGQWYVRAITPTPEPGLNGGNTTDWVVNLLKLSSQEGVIETPTEIPVNPPNDYMTGPANVRVVCRANQTGTERVAYIHLSHSDGYSTLKVIQKSR